MQNSNTPESSSVNKSYPAGGRYNWGTAGPETESSSGNPVQHGLRFYLSGISERRLARQASRDRRASRRQFRRAKRAYGRSWYLSTKQIWFLAVCWAGSCLLVSSLITLLWLSLIERVDL